MLKKVMSVAFLVFCFGTTICLGPHTALAAKTMPKGELIEFSFTTGGSSTFECNRFEVQLIDGQQHIDIDSWDSNNESTVLKGNIDEFEKMKGKNLLKQLEKIIRDNKLYAWNGFHESNHDILDGNRFSLSAKFSNQETIEARGNNSFPPDFIRNKETIISCFRKLL